MNETPLYVAFPVTVLLIGNVWFSPVNLVAFVVEHTGGVAAGWSGPLRVNPIVPTNAPFVAPIEGYVAFPPLFPGSLATLLNVASSVTACPRSTGLVPASVSSAGVAGPTVKHSVFPAPAVPPSLSLSTPAAAVAASGVNSANQQYRPADVS